jgi:hypothetical protein
MSTTGDAIAGEEGAAAVHGSRQVPPPLTKHRRRWPIWSEPQTPGTPCNICGFDSRAHSNVCPFGPEPTRSKERR